jgi:hypothetical protein
MTDDNFQNLSLNESFERVAKVAEERAAFNRQMIHRVIDWIISRLAEGKKDCDQ